MHSDNLSSVFSEECAINSNVSIRKILIDYLFPFLLHNGFQHTNCSSVYILGLRDNYCLCTVINSSPNLRFSGHQVYITVFKTWPAKPNKRRYLQTNTSVWLPWMKKPWKYFRKIQITPRSLHSLFSQVSCNARKCHWEYVSSCLQS